jgi:2-oxoglutarate ferredoxin oxidoreductase subunit beta
VQRADGSVEVVETASVQESALLQHDENHVEPSLAFALSRLTLGTVGAAPIGVFRDVERPSYDELMEGQLAAAAESRGKGDLAALIGSGDTWAIS